MDPLTGALVVGGIGALGGMYSANQTAEAQRDAANTASDTQRWMLEQQLAAMEPWRQSGNYSLDQLNRALYGTPSADQYRSVQGYVSPTGEFVTAIPNVTGVPGIGNLREQAQAAQNAQYTPATWYQDPITGEYISTIPVGAGTGGGELNPLQYFTTEDWMNSPEYAAQQAAIDENLNALRAQYAAGGMYGSGNMASALQGANVQGNLAAMGQSRQAWENERTRAYNTLAGMANPMGAQQISSMYGTYGANMSNLATNPNVGSLGAANTWGGAINNLSNQAMGAYGAYNQNQLMNNYLNAISPHYTGPTAGPAPVSGGMVVPTQPVVPLAPTPLPMVTVN